MNISKIIYGKLIEFMKAYMPKYRAKLAYYVSYRKKCDLQIPSTFSEKLLWLSLNTYRNNKMILDLSDKYLVREYVSNKGYSNILNELYFVHDRVRDIDFEKLPNQFALKVSQGCQTNLICKNKNEMDKDSFNKIINEWNKGQFLYDKMMADIGGVPVNELEKYYICERYLEDDQQEVPIDYKFYCFNGIPEAILVIADRFKEKKGVFMTPEWKFISNLTGNYKTPNKQFSKPTSLNIMVEVAKKLSAPFPFVRVDLYEINGQVVFGEMTFFPNGCIKMQETIINGKTMGELLDISEELNEVSNRGNYNGK